jgi:hypothetical protein
MAIYMVYIEPSALFYVVYRSMRDVKLTSMIQMSSVAMEEVKLTYIQL